MSDCIFCKIIAGEIPSTSVYEDERIYAFRDIHPQAPTHILIVPKEHRERITDYDAESRDLLGQLHIAANIIAKEQGVSSFRTVINCGEEAGQTVWHLHMHLLAGRRLGWPPG